MLPQNYGVKIGENTNKWLWYPKWYTGMDQSRVVWSPAIGQEMVSKSVWRTVTSDHSTIPRDPTVTPLWPPWPRVAAVWGRQLATTSRWGRSITVSIGGVSWLIVNNSLLSTNLVFDFPVPDDLLRPRLASKPWRSCHATDLLISLIVFHESTVSLKAWLYSRMNLSQWSVCTLHRLHQASCNSWGNQVADRWWGHALFMSRTSSLTDAVLIWTNLAR